MGLFYFIFKKSSSRSLWLFFTAQNSNFAHVNYAYLKSYVFRSHWFYHIIYSMSKLFYAINLDVEYVCRFIIFIFSNVEFVLHQFERMNVMLENVYKWKRDNISFWISFTTISI
jgi:hypothetical protein